MFEGLGKEYVGSLLADLTAPFIRGRSGEIDGKSGRFARALGNLIGIGVTELQKRLVRPELRQATLAVLTIGDTTGYRSEASKKDEERQKEAPQTRLYVTGFKPAAPEAPKAVPEKPPPLLGRNFPNLLLCHREAADGLATVPSTQERLSEDEFFDLLGNYFFDVHVSGEAIVIKAVPYIAERADEFEKLAEDRAKRPELWNRFYALKADGISQRLREVDRGTAGLIRKLREKNKSWLHS